MHKNNFNRSLNKANEMIHSSDNDKKLNRKYKRKRKQSNKSNKDSSKSKSNKIRNVESNVNNNISDLNKNIVIIKNNNFNNSNFISKVDFDNLKNNLISVNEEGNNAFVDKNNKDKTSSKNGSGVYNPDAAHYVNRNQNNAFMFAHNNYQNDVFYKTINPTTFYNYNNNYGYHQHINTNIPNIQVHNQFNMYMHSIVYNSGISPMFFNYNNNNYNNIYPNLNFNNQNNNLNNNVNESFTELKKNLNSSNNINNTNNKTKNNGSTNLNYFPKDLTLKGINNSSPKFTTTSTNKSKFKTKSYLTRFTEIYKGYTNFEIFSFSINKSMQSFNSNRILDKDCRLFDFFQNYINVSTFGMEVFYYYQGNFKIKK